MMGATNQFITVDPPKLRFQFELEKQSYCDLNVANTTDQHVAFKVKTTSPKKYFVRPNTGVIQPWDSSVIRVRLQARRENPPDMQCKDKFLLQTTNVPPHIDVDEVKRVSLEKKRHLASLSYNRKRQKSIMRLRMRFIKQHSVSVQTRGWSKRGKQTSIASVKKRVIKDATIDAWNCIQ